MNNSSIDFQQAELALAAYASLLQGPPDASALTNAGMTTVEADSFRSRWRVVDQFNSPTGLSATVFEDISTRKRYLAIRGTDSASILDYATDVVDIAVLGSRVNQLQYAVLKAKVQQWLDDQTLPVTFTVAGHSLGGFLAAGLAADFKSNVERAYLFNAPGVNGILSQATVVNAILETLGMLAPVDPSK